MRHFLAHKLRLVSVAADAVLTAVAYFFAHGLRFEWDIPPVFLALFGNTLPVLIMLRVVCFLWFGLYRGMWIYASLSDLLTIVKGVSAGSILFVVTLTLSGVRNFSRGIVVLDWLLAVFLIGGSRLSFRLWRAVRVPGERKHFPPVLVIGAGDAGEMMIRELLANAKLKLRPVGLIDDDANKWGLRIHGVPVLGAISEVQAIAQKYGVDEVLIALPSADRRTMRRIFDTCRQAGLRMKTIPGLGSLLAGTAKVSELREVRVEDLLRREPFHLDIRVIRNFLRGRRVLVTGAGGTIGAEICRQVAVCDPARLVMLEKGETALFEIDRELAETFPALRRAPIIGDVRNAGQLDELFGATRPDIVFHAAAYKHVPLMESHPEEAVLNNLVGTRNAAEAARRHGADRFVLVSTDKAVNPTSVMGATKRAAERYLQSLSAEGGRSQKSEVRSQNSEPTTDHRPLTTGGMAPCGVLAATRTIFCAVRFGNVLGSSGSVVPIFRRQIEQGGPVTVTHPEVARFFMTIPEAVQLVLRAATLAAGGEIFVLDMGEPVRIADLAHDMIRLSGLEPGRDIEIAFTGLRPGEKLFEELWYESEDVGPTVQDKLLVVRRTVGMTFADRGTVAALRGGEPARHADDRAVRRGDRHATRVRRSAEQGEQPAMVRRQVDGSVLRGAPAGQCQPSYSEDAPLVSHLNDLERKAIAGERDAVLATLKALVPEYLPAVPRPPYSPTH